MAIKVSPVNFLLAKNSAVVLHPATAEEKKLRGLQGMGLCLGFTMSTTEVDEIGKRIALEVPSGGKYEKSSVNYNFIPGDKSLEFFRNAAINSVLIQDVRMYSVQGQDFSAPDLISDPTSGLYVGSVGDPKAGSPSALYQGSLEYMPGGPFVLFVAHKKGITLSYVAATRTLTSSANDFISVCGFEADDTIIIDNVPFMTKPIYVKATSVAAGAIVLEDGVGDEALMTADWTGTATTAAHGATPLVVSDFS